MWQRTVFPLWMVDLFHIQCAAYQWHEGDKEWIYAPTDRYEQWKLHREPIAAKLGYDEYPNPYFYPPFLAAILAPVSDVSARTWRNVVFVLNTLLLFAFALLIARLCADKVSLRGLLWALALVLCAYPMSRASKLGQIVPLLAVLTWAGLLWMRTGKPIASGLLLGVTSAVRLFPLGLAILPLFARRWRILSLWIGSAIAIWVLSLFMLGPEIHRDWWEAAREFGTRIYPFFGNQSPAGWLVRLSSDSAIDSLTPVSNSALAVTRLLFALFFIGGSALVLWLKRAQIRQAAFPASAGLLMSGILLGMPNSWEHYWLFVLPVLGWAIHETWFQRDRRFWEFWLAVAAFLFLMKLTHFYGDSVTGRIASGSQTVGMLLFWIWLIRRVLVLPLRLNSN